MSQRHHLLIADCSSSKLLLWWQLTSGSTDSLGIDDPIENPFTENARTAISLASL
jgi:hypothetical protein